MTEQPPAGEMFVRSLARGLEVITAFDAEHTTMTLSEVAARTGLSRAAARRFLHTLRALGYVRLDGAHFALTPQVLRLGTAYLSGLGLPQVVQPHLERLTGEVGESTSAAVLDGPDIVYVARVATRRIMTVGITVGTRFPAYATSMGRVLLADLPDADLDAYLAATPLVPLTERTLDRPDALRAELRQVREQGWAAVDQELEAGLCSVAAPVRDASGRVVAALNISTSAVRSGSLPEAYVTRVVDTARAVSDDLAHAGR
ncbi:helix-turn-helix domain-containing protein [Nocardioides sp. cx-169]|uniref:IclR family transcriptional regulator domain-containing protein n=1 Tax=Nocardioides sp. cx-169 TaxID=2899080 RepID=UPI001E49AE93|nr:IclR family transcriptional regulator C-terminal domain-containing protein [Nocardioides sp. cx-169]MCD4535404.1 helix-turn-helix domain-containing protein [Nocardioides sp. cx-169]